MHLLPRKTWQKITSFFSISHSIPIFVDEIEICLFAYIVALTSIETIGLKISLVSCLLLHFLRGGYRWQLIGLYGGVLITSILSNLLYESLIKIILLLSAITTLALCYLIPSVPMMDGRGKPLGVQDLTFEGPSGQFWVKCFYPTRVVDKEKADDDNFPSENRGIMKLYVSLAIIMISVTIRMYLEGTDSDMAKEKGGMISLISFYLFPIIHLNRLLYDTKYALPSSPYISVLESTQVLNGIASFAKLPQFIFQHMKHMSINCTEDAPVCFHVTDEEIETEDKNKTPKQMKVAFLIHGLGGSRSLYSHICLRLASEGYFVICPEFGDRTACFSLLAGGETRVYTSYVAAKGEAELSEGYQEFRRNQLEHRAVEMGIIVKYFSSLGHQKQEVGKAGTVKEPLVRWNRSNAGGSFFINSLSAISIDTESRVGEKETRSPVSLDIAHPYLVGHSFGGATAIHLQTSNEKGAVQFRSIIER